MEVLALSVRLLVFTCVILLAIEQSLRVFYFGLDSFSPTKMNSYSIITDSGFVQRARDIHVYYELKPNLSAVFAGKRLVANSTGLADREYTLAKPDNVFRIAVVGSSWTMATSAEIQDTYHSLLEDELQAVYQDQDKEVEVINFGVEAYGLGEIVATTREKALEYQPDMIIFAITAITPIFKWQDEREAFEPVEIVPPFLQSYLYSSVSGILGLTPYAKTRRPSVDRQGGGYMRQVGRAMREIGELVSAKDIDVAVLWLTEQRYNESVVSATEKLANDEGFRFVQAHLDWIAEQQNRSENFMAGRVGRHPNKLGHRLIADKLLQDIWGIEMSNGN